MNFLKNLHLNDKQFFGIFFILLSVLSALYVVSYAMPIYPGHDFYFHEVRINALMDALKDGTFPYYIDYKSINGYGYLSRAFYSDVILVPFALLGNATSFEFAYQTMIFVMTMLCGIFTYYAVNTIFKNRLAASVSAILYTFCYYRVIDFFYRSALGESLSFTFLPLIYLGLYHIIKGDYKKWYIIAIGYSLMIFTHVISSALTFIIIIIFLGIYNKSIRQEPKRLAYLILAATTTILITSCYTFPMLEQMISNKFHYEYFHTNIASFATQFSRTIWSLFGGIIQSKQEFIPSIGITLTAAISLRLFIVNKTKLTKHADILAIVGIIFVIASSFIFPWDMFPFSSLRFIQFPWRLFEFASLFFAIAGGYYFATAFKNKKRMLVAYGLLIAIILFVFKSDGFYQGQVSKRFFQTDGFYGPEFDGKASLKNHFFLGGLEYLPASVPTLKSLVNRGDTIIAKNNSEIKNFTRNKNVINFEARIAADKDTFELPLTYYKGYKATIDGQEVQVQQSSNGLVEIDLEKSGQIEVYFNSTTIHRIANYITLVSVLALLIFIIALNRPENKDKYRLR